MINGIGNRRRCSDIGNFADPLDPERIDNSVHLQHEDHFDRFDIGSSCSASSNVMRGSVANGYSWPLTRRANRNLWMPFGAGTLGHALTPDAPEPSGIAAVAADRSRRDRERGKKISFWSRPSPMSRTVNLGPGSGRDSRLPPLVPTAARVRWF